MRKPLIRLTECEEPLVTLLFNGSDALPILFSIKNSLESVLVIFNEFMVFGGALQTGFGCTRIC